MSAFETCKWCGQGYQRETEAAPGYCSRRCHVQDPDRAAIVASTESSRSAGAAVGCVVLLILFAGAGFCASELGGTDGYTANSNEEQRVFIEDMARLQHDAPDAGARGPADAAPGQDVVNSSVNSDTCHIWRYGTDRRGVGRRHCGLEGQTSCGTSPVTGWANCVSRVTAEICDCTTP